VSTRVSPWTLGIKEANYGFETLALCIHNKGAYWVLVELIWILRGTLSCSTRFRLLDSVLGYKWAKISDISRHKKTTCVLAKLSYGTLGCSKREFRVSF